MPDWSSGLSILSKTSSHRSLQLERTSLTNVTAASGLSNTRSGSNCLVTVFIELYRLLREDASSQNIARKLFSSFLRRQYSRVSCVLPVPPTPISTTIRLHRQTAFGVEHIKFLVLRNE